MTDISTRTGREHPRLGWVLGLTSAAYFMVVLDALVVITALPAHAPGSARWVLDPERLSETRRSSTPQAMTALATPA